MLEIVRGSALSNLVQISEQLKGVADIKKERRTLLFDKRTLNFLRIKLILMVAVAH